MSLTRKYLNALGIEAEKIDEIINAHSETVNGLKGKIDELEESISSYKKNTETHQAVQKELDDLKKQVAAEAKEREGKDYDKLLKEFEDYKTEQKNREVRAAKETAYRAILKDAGIPERHFAKILKYSDVDSIELDDKGKAKEGKALLKEIKEEWGDHIEKEERRGAEVDNLGRTGGNGAGGGMTKEEIMKIEDRFERQNAIAENMELFG